MKTNNLKSSLPMLVALMLVSCATAPEKSRMIPYIDYSMFASSGRTLRITGVKGGEETGWDTPKIGNEAFREALLDTLEESTLFKEIFMDHAGDYELSAEIVAQKVVPGLTAYAALLVRYGFVESRTNQTVWQENIFSQNDAFGENQGKAVLEGVARDNLSQLIRKLAEILAEQ